MRETYVVLKKSREQGNEGEPGGPGWGPWGCGPASLVLIKCSFRSSNRTVILILCKLQRSCHDTERQNPIQIFRESLQRKMPALSMAEIV